MAVDVGTAVGVVTLPLLALGGLAWRSLEQAAKSQTDELMAELHWAKELARNLEGVRGTERQELRFSSYGELWTKMRPLAIYDDSPINSDTMSDMSKGLSGWYFSETGGLMLTSHNRDLYFALQDLLADVTKTGRWEAERTPDPRQLFERVLEREGSDTSYLGNADELIGHLDTIEIKDWPDSDLAVNSPFGITLGAGGAQAVALRVARAAAPVAAAPQQDPDQLDPPVDQLAVLGADELVPGPAARAAPLLRFQVDDALLGLQVRITAAAVPRRARTLPPPARAAQAGAASGRAVLASASAAAARGRGALFAGGAEQQPAQRRDRLLQPAHLGGQRGNPGVQLRVLLPQPRGRRLGLLGPGAPVADLSILIDHRRDRHVTQHTSLQQPRHAPNPACRDPGAHPPRDHRLLTNYEASAKIHCHSPHAQPSLYL